jgi:hypothetical protein
MATKVRLNNFRFSIYIDVDGTVTLTDLPPELHEVVQALDPTQQCMPSSTISAVQEAAPVSEGGAGALVSGIPGANSCRRMA